MNNKWKKKAEKLVDALSEIDFADEGDAFLEEVDQRLPPPRRIAVEVCDLSGLPSNGSRGSGVTIASKEGTAVASGVLQFFKYASELGMTPPGDLDLQFLIQENILTTNDLITRVQDSTFDPEHRLITSEGKAELPERVREYCENLTDDSDPTENRVVAGTLPGTKKKVPMRLMRTIQLLKVTPIKRNASAGMSTERTWMNVSPESRKSHAQFLGSRLALRTAYFGKPPLPATRV